MKIAVDNYWNVVDTAHRLKPDVVISLMDAARLAPSLHLPASRHLTLGFHDIQKPETGRSPPTRDQVGTLIEFAEHHRRSGAGLLLIHCMAGVSRSPAAAYILAVSIRNEDPLRAATLLFRAAPFADPNMLMVKHADAIIGLNGSMTEAVRNARKLIPPTSHQHYFCI